MILLNRIIKLPEQGDYMLQSGRKEKKNPKSGILILTLERETLNCILNLDVAVCRLWGVRMQKRV